MTYSKTDSIEVRKTEIHKSFDIDPIEIELNLSSSWEVQSLSTINSEIWEANVRLFYRDEFPENSSEDKVRVTMKKSLTKYLYGGTIKKLKMAINLSDIDEIKAVVADVIREISERPIK